MLHWRAKCVSRASKPFHIDDVAISDDSAGLVVACARGRDRLLTNVRKLLPTGERPVRLCGAV
eukprot:387845-Pyramimonas_sp.AAC.1